MAGPTFLVWVATPSLGGTAVWGRPSAPDAERLTALWDLDPVRVPGDLSVLHCRALVALDDAALRAAFPGIQRTMADFDHLARRHAVVVDRASAVGALIAGIFVVRDATHPFQLFDDLESAFAWLDPPEAAAVRLEVERLVERWSGGELLGRLRALLALDLAGASLPRAARALGVSTRSLQRGLGEAGRSFRGELDAARVAVATELLAQGAKLDEVARRVGSSSVNNFCTLYKRLTGLTPGATAPPRRR